MFTLRFNGDSFQQLGVNSQYEHTLAANSLGHYGGGAFVVGSYTPYNNKAEVLEFENGSFKWNLKQSYPYLEK